MQSVQQSREFERQIEAKVSAFRANPVHSSALLSEISAGIASKTFNSAALLRMKTEVLLLSRQHDEAVAAFNTYIALQKLSLYKKRSGASSLPDEMEGTVRVFQEMFTLLEHDNKEESLERIVDYGRKLEQIVTELPDDVNSTALIAPPLARAYFAKMLTSEGDEVYETALVEARRWFSRVESQMGDTDTLYAFGLFEALVGSPVRAFPHVRRSLEINPTNLRSALLLTQLLTTSEDKLDSALAVANSYLSQQYGPLTNLERLTLLQLKKTQIALLEKLLGRDAVLQELESFIETASSIYLVPKRGPRPSMKIETRRTLFGLKRAVSTVSVDASSPRNESSDRASVASSKAPASTADTGIQHRELAACWMWIAMQYAKFGLEAEAAEAVQESREMWPRAQTIKALAHSEALQGHILRTKDPQKALVHYRESLVSHSLHISSAVSATKIVCTIGVSENKELALLLLGFLESICARAPGRFLPETWYSRAMLHEALKGENTAHPFFWKAVELEERRAVTSYLLLNAAV